jgi:hypothetical protein
MTTQRERFVIHVQMEDKDLPMAFERGPTGQYVLPPGRELDVEFDLREPLDRTEWWIGWEWHGDPAPIPGLEIVATGATQSAPDKPNGGTYTATVYPGPRGNFVFNAATCWWADGLSAPPGYVRPKVYTEPKGPDRRVQEMTKNILERMRLSAAN